MTALTTLAASDNLLIDAVQYVLVGPSAVNPGTKTTGALCISKPPGQLTFKLNTLTDLGIQLPTSFDITFVGSFAGQTPAGDDIIDWKVNQGINVDITVSGIKVHIDDVVGDVLTLCRLRNPRSSDVGCDGVQRSIGVDLETVPGNTLTVNASILGIGTSIEARSVSFQARGGDHFAVKAKIHPVLDECGRTSLHQSFWVEVEGLSPGDVVSYNWSVKGAPITSSTTQSSIVVDLSGVSSSIQVTVTVTVNGVAQNFQLIFRPDDDLTVKMKTLQCKLKQLLNVNWRFNPLWDPLRDLAVRPYTNQELSTLLEFAEKIQENVRQQLAMSKES